MGLRHKRWHSHPTLVGMGYFPAIQKDCYAVNGPSLAMSEPCQKIFTPDIPAQQEPTSDPTIKREVQ